MELVPGHLPVIVRGFVPPRRSAEGNSSGLLVSLSTSLAVELVGARVKG